MRRFVSQPRASLPADQAHTRNHTVDPKPNGRLKAATRGASLHFPLLHHALLAVCIRNSAELNRNTIALFHDFISGHFLAKTCILIQELGGDVSFITISVSQMRGMTRFFVRSRS